MIYWGNLIGAINLINQEFTKLIKRDLYEKCQHKEDDTDICKMCHEIPINTVVSRSRRMILDLIESENSLGQSESDTIILDEDNIRTEITWDELGTEIFTVNSHIPNHLRTLIMNLSALE